MSEENWYPSEKEDEIDLTKYELYEGKEVDFIRFMQEFELKLKNSDSKFKITNKGKHFFWLYDGIIGILDCHYEFISYEKSSIFYLEIHFENKKTAELFQKLINDDNCHARASLVPIEWQKFSKALRLKQTFDLNDNNVIEKAFDELQKLDDTIGDELRKILNEKETKMEQEKRINYYEKLLQANRNLILTGAPGTGKTHLAKEVAKAMGCTDDEIGFVQFHPSYDYTDFVEGLRPKNDDGGNVGFERKDGVFKEFCKRALKAKDVERIQYNEDVSQTVNKKDVVTSYKNFGKEKFNIIYKSIVDDIKNRKITYYNTPTTRQNLSVKNERILFRANTNTERTESEDNFKLLYNYFIEKNKFNLSNITQPEWFNLITQVTNGRTKTIDYVEYSWLLQEMLNRTVNYLDSDECDVEQNNSIQHDVLNSVTIVPTTKIIKQPFVFIIDEINRGEISKIFGELFFSIDPGYRGTKGKVQTQYQNLVEDGDDFFDGFYVPENVYIIGTMNDIDRSVESMDFAFRRRFVFKEVSADDSAENMGITNPAMKRINDEIAKPENELGKDYQLGGAYFLDDMSDQERWDLKISGLIKEYLRGIDTGGEKFKRIEKAYFGKNQIAEKQDAESQVEETE